MKLLLDLHDVFRINALVDNGGVEHGLGQGAVLELVERDTASRLTKNLVVIRVELAQIPRFRGVGAREVWDGGLSDESDITIFSGQAAEGTLIVRVWVNVESAKVFSHFT